MKKLIYWTHKAESSQLYLALLNFGIQKMIPFNRPHGIRITHIATNSIHTKLPYRKRNLNHIGGLHACAMATLAEFTTGFMLVHRLDPARYRIIMQSMHMDYQYQGRKDAVVRYAIDDAWLEKHVLAPLQHQDATVCTCQATILDSDGEQLAEGTVNWQIKPWTKVRTAPQK